METFALGAALALAAPLASAQPEEGEEEPRVAEEELGDVEGAAAEEEADEGEADGGEAVEGEGVEDSVDAGEEETEDGAEGGSGEDAEDGEVEPPKERFRGVTNQALGDEVTDAVTGTPDWVDVGGYLEPGFGFRYRPDALPRDEFFYGFFGRAGLVVDARPFEMWHGRLNVVFDSDVLVALTDVDLIDTDGDGSADRTALTRRQVPGTILQEATVSFVPTDWIALRAGALRIPFTLQQQSANTQLMFPTRAAPNEIFLSGADFGAIAQGHFADGIFVTSVGVFGGESLGLDIRNTVARGAVFSARADVNPFGEFAFGGGDPTRGPFRLGIGGGMLARPATIFDANTGTEPRGILDMRFAASLRMAFKGLYVAAEYFRRQQTDDFSLRPEVADGAYAQVSMFIPVVPSFGLEPAGRVGFVARDQTFDPRLIGFAEGGVNLYPVADVGRGDAVRLTLQYLGERRFTEEEEAHGARAAFRLKF